MGTHGGNCRSRRLRRTQKGETVCVRERASVFVMRMRTEVTMMSKRGSLNNL